MGIPYKKIGEPVKDISESGISTVIYEVEGFHGAALKVYFFYDTKKQKTEVAVDIGSLMFETDYQKAFLGLAEALKDASKMVDLDNNVVASAFQKAAEKFENKQNK